MAVLLLISEIYLTSISISSNPFLIFLIAFLVLTPQIIIAIAPLIKYIHISTFNVRVVNSELQAMNSQIRVTIIHNTRTQHQFSTFNFLISKLSIINITHLTAITIHSTDTNAKIINSHAHGKHINNSQINVVSRELNPTKLLSSNHGFLMANAIPVIQKIKAQIANV